MVGVPFVDTLLSLSGVLYFPVQVARAPAVQELTLPRINDGGFFLQPGGSPLSLTTERWRPSVQKRLQGLLPIGSRVPHGTGFGVDKRDIRP